MNFLFWNTKNKDKSQEIAELFLESGCEIAAFAEYNSDDRAILAKLLKKHCPSYFLPNIGCTGIKILTKRRLSDFSIKFETERITVRELKSPGLLSTLICVVHLPSKLYMSEDDQNSEARYLKQDIEMCETEAGHDNTLIFGDFNMNPFDSGMYFADALHSVPCKVVAAKGHRTVSGRQHKFFYNPSWNLLGDRNSSPGTYYFKSGSYSRMHWNVLDQVIMRPSLADRYSNGSLKTVACTATTAFTDHHKRPIVSDHLPITFDINLNMEISHEELMA
ncbi:TPA: endonuclease/exonuclease/phosphatase family protein [Pseudomonas aeruginosa]|uniref:endonuclease/exonuclease/phosphatase family protein n=1 Tax=Pseudomonas aeruginosa TaxID=287 RepID=UPI001298D130|nr:endonuclease/exonuclease/phosphatase family protein [Pseudomonas aeruginosa]HEP9528334.1 endonuclease/exonuclease/phosphatase family protein [Pseudomonas aeruginosa]HEP9531075.1 endonuclease/exonuclease/phosphatase family protein [Pseudomonas aeruginosa]